MDQYPWKVIWVSQLLILNPWFSCSLLFNPNALILCNQKWCLPLWKFYFKLLVKRVYLDWMVRYIVLLKATRFVSVWSIISIFLSSTKKKKHNCCQRKNQSLPALTSIFLSYNRKHMHETVCLVLVWSHKQYKSHSALRTNCNFSLQR